VAPRHDVSKDVLEPRVVDAEVDEAGPGHLGADDQVRLREMPDDRLCDLARRASRALRKPERDARGEISEALLARTLQLDLRERLLQPELGRGRLEGGAEERGGAPLGHRRSGGKRRPRWSRAGRRPRAVPDRRAWSRRPRLPERSPGPDPRPGRGRT